MRIVVTGGDGFIGQNLRLRLHELGYADVRNIERDTSVAGWSEALTNADIVFHLAGVNRPSDEREFTIWNATLTQTLCLTLTHLGRPIPLVLSSSTQALLDNPYGNSKRNAEAIVERYSAETGARIALLRLTNVFGKWCRPNYNSAVATFCHNISRGLPITVSDSTAPIRLVYIDDVVDAMIGLLDESSPSGFVDVGPIYATTVGDLVRTIREFAESRAVGTVGPVGTGFIRALYATYLSYLPTDAFAYSLCRHEDPRGVFVEMLKTRDAGQFSFFSAHPGVMRGGHYHHTKVEKFLVLSGQARFRFRHIVTGQRFDLLVTGKESRVVETAPGWVHDITNVGDDELIALLWANEAFDPMRPDTITAEVQG